MADDNRFKLILRFLKILPVPLLLSLLEDPDSSVIFKRKKCFLKLCVCFFDLKILPLQFDKLFLIYKLNLKS